MQASSVVAPHERGEALGGSSGTVLPSQSLI